MASSERSVIVTGSSQGIGAAVAERLAQDGWAVTINFSGNEAPAVELAQQVQAAGGNAIAVKADVSDPAQVSQLFDATEQAFGGVDAIVNNAGIMKLTKIVETDDETFDRHIAVNLKGVFNCLREGGRRLRDGGRIVSFSTSVIGLSPPTYGVYGATKAGVEAMSRVLVKELAPRGITVNMVAPGPTATKLFLADKSEAQIEGTAKLIPLGRLGEPGDIAGAVSFLLGPDGAWVNGQVLRVNGGMI
ncbi:SDR family oxidoreductase (plasmid) [Skermanella sp. TT6]|uniref:SDR family oxidoreductase n=1 Tax=Skermanella cutis TaxID=2775420 RepID=A0ABX7BH42_9PROT|nr:SDR family oxidoreductase [Skermanella sp. TT6]QQP93095.1 SDR family oxidoreductase [Skermanella sp. TT6]QQP93252.1 SDR family oxidoreductase [Skermanella sp. TT6]